MPHATCSVGDVQHLHFSYMLPKLNMYFKNFMMPCRSFLFSILSGRGFTDSQKGCGFGNPTWHNFQNRPHFKCSNSPQVYIHFLLGIPTLELENIISVRTGTYLHLEQLLLSIVCKISIIQQKGSIYIRPILLLIAKDWKPPDCPSVSETGLKHYGISAEGVQCSCRKE